MIQPSGILFLNGGPALRTGAPGCFGLAVSSVCGLPHTHGPCISLALFPLHNQSV